MFYYFLKKGFTFVFTLWCVFSLTFFLMHAIPGDPFIGDLEIPEEAWLSLKAHHGLDQPLFFQYFRYLKNVCCFDLGPSLAYPGQSVSQMIAQRFPVSAILGLEALLLAVAAGLGFGLWSALRSSRFQQETASILSLIGLSLPVFVTAALLQWVFAIQLHWLPVARWGSLAHTILPALSLALLPMASIARLTRAGLIEVFTKDYIQAAQSRGFSKMHIALCHGLKGALFPLIAYLGPAAIHLLTGSLIVEKIFSIPGLGQSMISSLVARDYPMILGLTLFSSSFLMFSSFVVDTIFAYLDPR